MGRFVSHPGYCRKKNLLHVLICRCFCLWPGVAIIVDDRGCGPFLLGDLPLSGDLLPATWYAQGSGLWKLETTTFEVGVRLKFEG